MHVKEIIYMIVIPFLFVLSIIPVIKRVANHVGALDVPNARKVHKVPIPRLGGLGIYMGFLLGYILFGTMSLRMTAILIGSFIIISGVTIVGIVLLIRVILLSGILVLSGILILSVTLLVFILVLYCKNHSSAFG